MGSSNPELRDEPCGSRFTMEGAPVKIHVEIDCTPEEARSFLGLPDLRPVQAAVMAKIEEQMLDAVSNPTPAAMRAWWPWAQFANTSRDTAETATQATEKSAAQTSRKGSRPSADKGE
jgi:Family of unknown function (DUF6489)